MGDHLAGKVAVITGTASGQGAVAARLFPDEGAVVEGCDIDSGDGWATVQAQSQLQSWVARGRRASGASARSVSVTSGRGPNAAAAARGVRNVCPAITPPRPPEGQ